MEFGLRGRKIAVIVGGGMKRAELEEAWKPLEESGAELHILTAAECTVPSDMGDEQSVTTHALDSVAPEDYVALLLPGGDMSSVAGDEKATAFVRGMMEADKPVAAVGLGAELLIAANAVRGRTLSTHSALRDQIDGAGGSWVEKSFQVDQKLITSSSSKAIPELGKRLVTEFSNKLDSARVDQLSQQSFPASDPPPGPGSIGAASASNTRGEASPR